MTDRLLVALAQLNPTVGDVAGNLARARDARRRAAALGADLVLFPELFLAGYPPEDLVLKPSFQAACMSAAEDLAKDTADGGPAMLVGTPWKTETGLYNAVALLDEGRIAALRFKYDLPNYGPFDEKRVFTRGDLAGPIPFRGIRLGVPICEDVWGPDPVECISETGGDLILVPNGSPYRRKVMDERFNVAVARVKESGLSFAYLNQVGGQDELVFDGASFVLDAEGRLVRQMAAFREEIAVVEYRRVNGRWGPVAGDLTVVEEDVVVSPK